MLLEEHVDLAVRRPLDLPIVPDVAAADVRVDVELAQLEREQPVLVVGVTVTNEGARSQCGTFVERQLLGPPNPAAADHRSAVNRATGDLVCGRLMLRGERQPSQHCLLELGAICGLCSLSLATARLALRLAPRGGDSRSLACCRNRFDRGEQTQLAAMLPATLRAEQNPVVAGGLHLPREERVAGGQQLPAVRLVEIAEIGMPQPRLGVVRLQMQPCGFLIDHHETIARRGLRIQHRHQDQEPLAPSAHTGQSALVSTPEHPPVLLVDGSRFTDFEGFAAEFSALLTDHTWRGNLDALNDILRGGFGTPDGGFILRWKDSGLSRHALSYEATAARLETLLLTCHPSNREGIAARLDDARRGVGLTLFDEVVEIIKIHGPGGQESESGVQLELRWPLIPAPICRTVTGQGRPLQAFWRPGEWANGERDSVVDRVCCRGCSAYRVHWIRFKIR